MTEDKNVVSSTRRRLNEQKKLRRGVRENETKSYREREREKRREGGTKEWLLCEAILRKGNIFIYIVEGNNGRPIKALTNN